MRTACDCEVVIRGDDEAEAQVAELERQHGATVLRAGARGLVALECGQVQKMMAFSAFDAIFAFASAHLHTSVATFEFVCI